MSISVVIPVQERCDRAWRCFLSLAELPERPDHEIVIVDDGAPGLGSLLEQLSGDVAVLRCGPHAGFAAAARAGAAHATGDVLVFLRATPEVGDDWLAPLAAALERDGVSVAASVRSDEPRAHPVTSPAFAVTRSVLTAAGGLADVRDDLVLAALAADAAPLGRTIAVAASTVAVAPAGRAPGSRAPGAAPELSIVIPTLAAAGDRVRRCLEAIGAATDVPHEILIADNGGSPQGYTAPVNAGVRAASGRYVVVMNDDVAPLPGWWPPLREMLDAGAMVAFPHTVDGPMRSDFAAWCFAFRRDGMERFAHAPGELFDPRFTVWYQDSDLLVRLTRAGAPPRLVRASEIHHGLSETVHTADPELRAWIKDRIAADYERFRAKHPDVVMGAVRADLTTPDRTAVGTA
jgi:GT2 family glycosyltransferase